MADVPPRPMRRLFSYLGPQRRQLWVAVFYSFVNKLLDLAPPVLVAWSIDTVTGHAPLVIQYLAGDSELYAALVLGGLAIFIFGFESVFEYLYTIGFRNLAQSVQHRLRLDAYAVMQDREMAFFESQRVGETMSILSDDVNQLENFLNTVFNSDQAVKSLFKVWQGRYVSELLQWLCDYNQTHREDPVTFFGFDTQQAWDDADLLEALATENWPAESSQLIERLYACAAASYDSTRHWYQSTEYKQLVAGDQPITWHRHGQCLSVLAEFDHRIGELATSATDSTVLAKAAVVGLRAFHEQMFYNGLAATEDSGLSTYYTMSTESRDLGMARVFQLMHQFKAPNQKTILWANNFHISKLGDSSFRGPTRSMGFHLHQALGQDYFAVGLIGHQVEYNWPGMAFDLHTPNDQTSLDVILNGFGSEALLLDLNNNGLVTTRTEYQWGGEFRYPELTIPGAKGIPAQHFDAVVFLRHSPAMQYVE